MHHQNSFAEDEETSVGSSKKCICVSFSIGTAGAVFSFMDDEPLIGFAFILFDVWLLCGVWAFLNNMLPCRPPVRTDPGNQMIFLEASGTMSKQAYDVAIEEVGAPAKPKNAWG